MRLKKKKMLGIILSLVLVLGLMPGMSLTALADDPYAALKNSTTLVKFDDKDWYLINYDNDTVTLLSKACVGASIFGSNDTYSGSTVESYVKNWYEEYISSDAKKAVSGNGAFLLSLDDVAPISANVRACSKASGADFNGWWLSSSDGDGAARAIFAESGWGFSSSVVSHKLGVRPALKLDLSSVIFDSQSNEFTVNIKVDVTGVTLNKTAVTLNANGTETLTATVAPNNATDKTITWSSDNTAVATVSNGVVTAVAEGIATITVTATNGTEDTSDDKTATCEVTVNVTSSGGDSSDSGNSGSSDSGSTSGGSSDSGSSSGSSSSSNTSSGTSSSSSTSTSTSTTAPATVPYENVAISTGAVNDITGTAAATAEKNPFGTKIENNDNLTTLLSLTPEEVAQGVNVWLDIQDMSATVPQADKDLVQSASNDFTVGMYLDISLFKKVGGNAATKITETNGTVKASILIPESLWKAGRTFEIIRVHDGVPTVITGTYDENTHVFTFETDKFSTYALAYNDSANSTQSSAPRTGDNNHLGVWYLLLAMSLGGLGFLAYSKKRKVNK